MPESRPLEGRVALVTGASSGIGLAAAERLATLGARISATARRADRLDTLVRRIEDGGGTALAVPADVTDLEAVRAAVRTTTAELGPIDILINNAGIMPVAPITEVRVDDWARMVDVNVKGVLHVLGAVLPGMLEREAGHIVSVGSLASRRPFPGGTVYAATKFAVRALGWGLHLELGNAHGIRVTDIQPGVVATELLDDDPDVAAAWAEAWKDRRMLQPEDIARAIEFVVTSPGHVSVSELLVRPTDQPT